MSKTVPKAVSVRKSGSEPFHNRGVALDLSVLDFWRWSTSDLLGNATRGVLAEYMVAIAVGDGKDVPSEWEPFDATTDGGVRIEVKSSAYLQSWFQDSLSRISFGTRPTRAWDADTNSLAEERKRQSDVYVFCLLARSDQATVDPLDASQWRFFVISTELLNARVGKQKSIGLNALRRIGAKEVEYDGLKDAVEMAV